MVVLPEPDTPITTTATSLRPRLAHRFAGLVGRRALERFDGCASSSIEVAHFFGRELERGVAHREFDPLQGTALGAEGLSERPDLLAPRDIERALAQLLGR